MLLNSYIQTRLAAGRVKAVLHHVRDCTAGAGGIVPRRDAAIFFVAPDVSAPLETIVREGEVLHYAGLLTHGEFKVCCCSDGITAVLRRRQGMGHSCQMFNFDLMGCSGHRCMVAAAPQKC